LEKFTLIFEGLDKPRKHFDLVEDIPEPGGFIIKRNKSDVYDIFIKMKLPAAS